MHSFNSAPVLSEPIECQKSINTAYDGTYLITLSFNLSSTNLATADAITFLHNFVGLLYDFTFAFKVSGQPNAFFQRLDSGMTSVAQCLKMATFARNPEREVGQHLLQLQLHLGNHVLKWILFKAKNQT